ncbi:MAG: hypothetical protein KDC05_10575 [Bacteroidales bacterium]|nr:hypothetical protein [Bacteroidales bacterium]
MTLDSYFQFMKWAFILWTSGVIVLLILFLKKYTFGNWTPDNPNPYHGETLGMPRGFFRSVLTLSLLFVVVLLQIGYIRFDIEEIQVKDMMTAFQMMLAFYFGSKVMHHLASTDKIKTKAIAENIKVSSEAETAQKADFEKEGSVG